MFCKPKTTARLHALIEEIAIQPRRFISHPSPINNIAANLEPFNRFNRDTWIISIAFFHL